MRLEVSLITLVVLGAIRLLYQYRQLPWIGPNLTLYAALLLTYVPLLHNWLRHLQLGFLEKSRAALLSSLRIFLVTSALLFPLFLIGNHFYQQLLLGRTFSWQLPSNLLSLCFTQLFLIALPEEFFFRGWLQTLLSRRLASTRAILLGSLLFAAAHSLIALQWWHFAIFFPGCVFGWLREKTGAVTAPILFHTVSNLLAAWIGVGYQ